MSARHDQDDKDDREPTPPELVGVARHIQPVGPRILVRIVKSPDRSESGLYLPQGVKEGSVSALLGEVIEVARTMAKGQTLSADDELEYVPEDEERPTLGENVSGIPLGAYVLFEKDRGIAIPWDESLRLLQVRYVLALVEFITEDEIQ